MWRLADGKGTEKKAFFFLFFFLGGVSRFAERRDRGVSAIATLSITLRVKP